MHSTYNGMATVLVIIITDREGKPMRSQVRQLVFSKNGHRNIFIRTCSSRTCHSLSRSTVYISFPWTWGDLWLLQPIEYGGNDAVWFPRLVYLKEVVYLKSYLKKKKHTASAWLSLWGHLHLDQPLCCEESRPHGEVIGVVGVPVNNPSSGLR